MPTDNLDPKDASAYKLRILLGQIQKFEKRNTFAVLEKYNCVTIPFRPEISSVAVKMSYTLEQIKEMMDEMTRKVAEFVETNTEVASENVEEMANNLKEGWEEMTGKVEEFLEYMCHVSHHVYEDMEDMANNLVERLGGDDNIAFQVFLLPIFSSLDILFKVVIGATLLLITLPFWIYQIYLCIAGEIIKCDFPFRQFLFFRDPLELGLLSDCS